LSAFFGRAWRVLRLAMEDEAMMAELAELADTPAATLAGLRAKGEVLADHLGLTRADEPLEEDRIAWSVVEDLLRLIPPSRGAGG
jgi:hypothetical protein